MYFKTEKGPVRVSSMAIHSNTSGVGNSSGEDSWVSKYYYWVIGAAAIVVIGLMIYSKQNKK
jgi:hypothetical protein